MNSFPTVCILAGGLGTRLKDVVPGQQKVIADIGGKPYIVRLIEQVASAGATDVVLCTGYRGEKVAELIGDSCTGVRIQCSQENERLGTGGALALAVSFVKGDNLIAMNGDSYCGVDFPRLLRAHNQSGCLATVSVVQVEDTSRFGRVEMNDANRITKFIEKGGVACPGNINAGVYVMKTSMLSGVCARKEVSLEREIFPQYLKGDLLAFQAKGPFIDIGTPASFASATEFFSSLEAEI